MIANRIADGARRALVALTAASSILILAPAANAANYGSMTCSQLWYARNSIYAENGYCFKTAKARAVFGPGCFPPYGKLSKWEQQQVDQIRYWENRKGCS